MFNRNALLVGFSSVSKIGEKGMVVIRGVENLQRSGYSQTDINLLRSRADQVGATEVFIRRDVSKRGKGQLGITVIKGRRDANQLAATFGLRTTVRAGKHFLIGKREVFGPGKEVRLTSREKAIRKGTLIPGKPTPSVTGGRKKAIAEGRLIPGKPTPLITGERAKAIAEGRLILARKEVRFQPAFGGITIPKKTTAPLVLMEAGEIKFTPSDFARAGNIVAASAQLARVPDTRINLFNERVKELNVEASSLQSERKRVAKSNDPLLIDSFNSRVEAFNSRSDFIGIQFPNITQASDVLGKPISPAQRKILRSIKPIKGKEAPPSFVPEFVRRGLAESPVLKGAAALFDFAGEVGEVSARGLARLGTGIGVIKVDKTTVGEISRQALISSSLFASVLTKEDRAAISRGLQQIPVTEVEAGKVGRAAVEIGSLFVPGKAGLIARSVAVGGGLTTEPETAIIAGALGFGFGALGKAAAEVSPFLNEKTVKVASLASKTGLGLIVGFLGAEAISELATAKNEKEFEKKVRRLSVGIAGFGTGREFGEITFDTSILAGQLGLKKFVGKKPLGLLPPKGFDIAFNPKTGKVSFLKTSKQVFPVGKQVSPKPGAFGISGKKIDFGFKDFVAVSKKPGAFGISGKKIDFGFKDFVAVSKKPGVFGISGKKIDITKGLSPLVSPKPGAFVFKPTDTAGPSIDELIRRAKGEIRVSKIKTIKFKPPRTVSAAEIEAFKSFGKSTKPVFRTVGRRTFKFDPTTGIEKLFKKEPLKLDFVTPKQTGISLEPKKGELIIGDLTRSGLKKTVFDPETGQITVVPKGELKSFIKQRKISRAVFASAKTLKQIDIESKALEKKFIRDAGLKDFFVPGSFSALAKGLPRTQLIQKGGRFGTTVSASQRIADFQRTATARTIFKKPGLSLLEKDFLKEVQTFGKTSSRQAKAIEKQLGRVSETKLGFALGFVSKVESKTKLKNALSKLTSLSSVTKAQLKAQARERTQALGSIIGVALTPKQISKQTTKLRQALGLISTQKRIVSVIPKQDIISTQTLKEIQKLTQVEKEILKEKKIVDNIFKFPSPVATKGKGKRKTTPGYNTFLKVKGSFKKQTPRPLHKSSARALGAFLADNSPARSFLIKKSKKRATGKVRRPNLTKFRKPRARSRLPMNSLVEKSRFAIDSPGELKGITQKGLNALRGQFFRQRKKSKRGRKRGSLFF